MVNYRVVAIGIQGAGKTSFFNKICNTDEKVSGGLKSCTELITSANSKFGEAFTMVDTPGISFTKNIFENTIAIVAALTDGDIKYFQADSVFEQIQKIMVLVAKHKPLLGVVITHFDQCEIELQEQYKIEVRELIKSYYQIDLVLFSGQKTPAQELCLDILNSLDRQGKKLVISENRFNEMLRTFKFSEQLDVGKKAFITKLEQFALTIKKYIQDFDTTVQNSDQILHALLIFIRKEQKVMMENFETQYGSLMYELYEQSNNPLQSYYCHYVIKFHLKQQIQQLIDQINKKMVYHEDHPYRSLRRCPCCRTIWFKVIGCDNTHCGNRDYDSDEEEIRQSMPTYYEYKFYYLNKDVIEYKHIISENDFQNNDNQENQVYKDVQGYNFIDSQIHQSAIDNQQIIDNQQDIQEDILITKYPLDGSQLMEFSTYHKVDNFPDNLKQKWEEITKLQQSQLQNLKTVQINQVQEQQQIGCGMSFNWENEAEFVDLEELKLNHAPILGIFSDKDELYQREFNYMKGSLIEKAKKLQKIIQN